MQTQKAQQKSGKPPKNGSAKVVQAHIHGSGFYRGSLHRRDKYEYQAEEAARRIMRGEGGVARLLTPRSAASYTLGTSVGQPLAQDIRQELEKGFEADLGAVRIHHNSSADTAAKNEGAKAFASGRDIFFAAGAYNPFSESGEELLIHEVAHVLQQTGRISSQGRIAAADIKSTGVVQFDKIKAPKLTDTEKEIEKEIETLRDGPLVELMRNIEVSHYGNSVLLPYTNYQPEDAVVNLVARLVNFADPTAVDEKKELDVIQSEVMSNKFNGESIVFKGYLFDLLKVKKRWRGARKLLDRDPDIMTSIYSPAFKNSIFTNTFYGLKWLVELIDKDDAYKNYRQNELLEKIWYYLLKPSAPPPGYNILAEEQQKAYTNFSDNGSLGSNERVLLAWDFLLFWHQAFLDTVAAGHWIYKNATAVDRKKGMAHDLIPYAELVRKFTFGTNSDAYFKSFAKELKARAEQAFMFWSAALELDKELLKSLGNPFNKKGNEYNFEEKLLLRAQKLFAVVKSKILNPWQYHSQVSLFKTIVKQLIRKLELKIIQGVSFEKEWQGQQDTMLVALGGMLQWLFLIQGVLDKYSFKEDIKQRKKYTTDDVRHANRIQLAVVLWHMSDLFAWESLRATAKNVLRAKDLPSSVLAVPDMWQKDKVPVHRLQNDFGPDTVLRGLEPWTAGHLATFFTTKFYMKVVEEISKALPDQAKKSESEEIAEAIILDLNKVKKEKGKAEGKKKKKEEGPKSRLDKAFENVKNRYQPVRMIFPHAQLAIKDANTDLMGLMENHDKIQKLLKDQQAFKNLNLDMNGVFPLFPIGFGRGVFLWLIPYKHILLKELLAALKDTSFLQTTQGSIAFSADEQSDTITAGGTKLKKGEVLVYYRFNVEIVDIVTSFRYTPPPPGAVAQDQTQAVAGHGEDSAKDAGEPEQANQPAGTVTRLDGSKITGNPLLVKLKLYEIASGLPGRKPHNVKDVIVHKEDSADLSRLSRMLEILSLQPVVEEISKRLEEDQRNKIIAAKESMRRAALYQRVFTSAGIIVPLLKGYDKSNAVTMFYPIKAFEAIQNFENFIKPAKPKKGFGEDKLRPENEYRMQMAALFLEIAQPLYEALSDSTRFDVITRYLDYLVDVIDFVTAEGFDKKSLIPYLDLNATAIEYDADAEESKEYKQKKGETVDISWIDGKLMTLAIVKQNFEKAMKFEQATFGFTASTDEGGTLQSLIFHSRIRVLQEPDHLLAQSEKEAKKDAEEDEEESLLDVEQVKGVYQILAVHTPFVFHPHYGREGSKAYREPQILTKLDGEKLAPGTPLLKVKFKDQIIKVYNKEDQFELLESIARDVDDRGFRQSMANLEAIIIAWAKVMLELLELTPLAPAVIAARVTYEVGQVFISADSPYQVLKKLLSEGIDEKFEEFTRVLEFDNLILFALFGNPWLEQFLERGGKEKKVSGKKTSGKRSTVKKLIELGKKIAKFIKVALTQLNNRVQDPMRDVRAFVSTRPVLAAAIEFAADHIEELVRLAEIIAEADGLMQMAKDPSVAINDQLDKLQSKLNAFGESIEGFELPRDEVIDIVPMISGLVGVLIEFLAKRIGKRIKYKKVPVGQIAPLVVKLLREVGAIKLVSDKAAVEIIKLTGDPNDLWRDEIAPSIEKDFEKGRELLVGYLDQINDALNNLRGSGSQGKKTKATPFVDRFSELRFNVDLRLDESGGAPLSPSQRQDVESRFGHDFAHVRLHDDRQSAEQVDATGAAALTSSSHIYLGRGLNTAAGRGKSILDHELVHVLQQTGPRPKGEYHTGRAESGQTGAGLSIDRSKESDAERLAAMVHDRRDAEGPLPVKYSGRGIFPFLDLLTVHRILSHMVDLSSIKNQQLKWDKKPGISSSGNDLVDKMVKELAKIVIHVNKKINKNKVKFSRQFKSDVLRDQIQDRFRWGGNLDESEKEMKKRAMLIAKGEITKKKEKGKLVGHFDETSFLRKFESYVLAKSGIAISVDLAEAADVEVKKHWPGAVKEIKILHIHLPFIHGSAKIWADVIHETWFANSSFPSLANFNEFRLDTSGIIDPVAKKEAEDLNLSRKHNHNELGKKNETDFIELVRPRIKAYLGSRSLSPIIWEKKKSGKLRFRSGTKVEIERLMIEPKGGGLAPGDLPSITEYIKTGRDPLHPEDNAPPPATAIRLDLNTHAAQKSMPSKDRESHHLTQYLLAEYFHNTAANKKPFPQSWKYPGVEKTGDAVKSFRAKGEDTLNIAEMEAGRGGIMPAILISAYTHRRGDLHVTREADDIADSDKKVQSHFINNAFFQNMPADMAKAMQADKRDDMTAYITKHGEDDVTLKIHSAMITSYRKMNSYMMKQLRDNMPQKEMEYYAGLFEVTAKVTDKNRKDYKSKFKDVAKQGEKYNAIMMEKLGWK